MARIAYLDPEDLKEEDRKLLARPANLFRALVHSPDGFRAFSRLGGYIRNESTLDPRLRELAILQVGYLTRSEYEYSHHIQLGRDQFGVSDDDIRAIAEETEGRESGLPELDRTVLKAAREMTSELAVSDATFAALQRHLGEAHLVDLLLAIGFYNGVVRILASLQIDVEESYRPLLRQFPLPS